MTIHDDLETIPPEHRDQARGLLARRAAIAALPAIEETHGRRQARFETITKWWLIVGLILAVIGIIGSITKIEPTEIALVCSVFGGSIALTGLMIQQVNRYTTNRNLLVADMVPTVIDGYDQLLDQLRAGRPLAEEQIMDNDLRALAALDTRPSRAPIFIAGVVGVCWIALLVVGISAVLTS